MHHNPELVLDILSIVVIAAAVGFIMHLLMA